MSSKGGQFQRFDLCDPIETTTHRNCNLCYQNLIIIGTNLVECYPI